jgi:hypothetical protein
MGRVEFTADENGVTLDGHRYEAFETPGSARGECKGCAFVEGFGCELAGAIYTLRDHHRQGVTKCAPKWRKDGRGIIWVSAAQAKRRQP